MSKPVYSNYEDAVDTDISKIKSKAVKIADTLSSLIAGDKKIIPTGLSNCTLTATQWVNPKVPINRALTIIDKGKKYGYVEIPESHAQEGDLIIATNPNDNSHHTMLLTGFNNGQTTHLFQGNNYLLPNDHPLVTYSNGLTTKAGLRTNLGLKEYLDNSGGKSQVLYFRYIKPGTNEVLLPEITVTPNGNYVKEGLKTIYINRYQKGGDISLDKKIDFLTHLYRNDDSLEPVYNKSTMGIFKGTNDEFKEYVDFKYNQLKNDPEYSYVPLEHIPTVVGYRPLILKTWYPMVHEYYDSKKDGDFKWTGHSELMTGTGEITKYGDEEDYNLVTNNCSDTTRLALETVFNKSLDTIAFTTPGDVRDFTLLNGGISKDKYNRRIIIPMNKERYNRLRKFREQK